MIPPNFPKLRGSRLGHYAPLPLVGVATLLVALIVFTPVLVASGPSALSVRAELSVYRVIGSASTQFYLHAVGDVAYASVQLAVGTWSAAWAGVCPTSGIVWSYDNRTDAQAVVTVANSTPVVVDAVATYDQGGTLTIYAGELAFDIVALGASDESVSVVTCSATPGLSAPGSIPTSALPVGLYLVNYGSSGPP